MAGKDRLSEFLKLQNKKMSFEDISKELGISQSTLRQYLNKKGYISKNGKYEPKLNQIKFEVSKEEKVNTKNKEISSKKSTKAKEIKILNKTKKPKVDKKINVTQVDIDNLYEVYDWYLQVKDLDIYKSKRVSKKDVKLENEKIINVKSTSIRVDKDTWEDFERLCSNSSFGKQEILTQALKEFVKKYKNLI